MDSTEAPGQTPATDTELAAAGWWVLCPSRREKVLQWLQVAVVGLAWLHIALRNWPVALVLAAPAMALCALHLRARPPSVRALGASRDGWQLVNLQGEVRESLDVRFPWRSEWLLLIDIRSPERHRIAIWPDSLAEHDRRRLYRAIDVGPGPLPGGRGRLRDLLDRGAD